MPGPVWHSSGAPVDVADDAEVEDDVSPVSVVLPPPLVDVPGSVLVGAPVEVLALLEADPVSLEDASAPAPDVVPVGSTGGSGGHAVKTAAAQQRREARKR